MNIFNSGKIPEKSKKIALSVILLSLTAVPFSGCAEPGGSVPAAVSSAAEQAQVSEPDIISQGSSVTDVPGSASVPSSSFSAAGVSTSSEPASASSPESTDAASSSDTETSSEPAPVSVPDISSAAPAVSSAPQEPVSVPPVSVPEVSVPVSSQPAVSVPDPEPLAPVVVPYIEMPTSPGVDYESSANGVIDYSNSSKGYISVRYTGSCAKTKLTIEYGDEQYRYNPDPNGRTEYFPLSCGSGNYRVALYENTHDTKYALVVSVSFNANISNSLSPYLYPNQYSDFSSSSKCVYKAAELCAGKTGTIDKIAAIFGWVTANVTYDYALADSVQSGYVPDPDRTYSLRTGICFDYSSLMCAMLRSQSIPTRLVIGYANPGFYHAWNEIYTAETGWISPEVYLRNAGYNLADATIYAQYTSKQKAADYMQNTSNYQAVTYH